LCRRHAQRYADSIQSLLFKHAKEERSHQKVEWSTPASYRDAGLQVFELDHDPSQLLF
jgi:hypothetical protein